MEHRALSIDQLRTRCDPAELGFETTAELDATDELARQERATEALRFGLGIRREGYNLFVLGPTGAGKHRLTRRVLDGLAASEPRPDDWCYVQDLSDPHRPRALRLPAGRGAALAGHVERLVRELREAIPAAFETDEYHHQVRVLAEAKEHRHEEALAVIRDKAEAHGLRLVRTPSAFALAPVKDGEILGPEEFEALPEDERTRLRADIEALEVEVRELVRHIPRWHRELRDELRALKREVTDLAVSHLVDEVRHLYEDLPQVLEWLDEVQADILEHAEAFESGSGGGAQAPLGLGAVMGDETSDLGQRYRVNLLVDASDSEGAPIVWEDHPVMEALVGRIEHRARMGTLFTDHTMIMPGALHRANGGYLLLDARRVLSHPYAWEALKRALRRREVKIQSLGQALGILSTLTLEPKAIPLDTKVVLFGERWLYYALCQVDPEFRQLFEVAADLEDDQPRDARVYARWLAGVANREGLRPLDAGAVARLVERGARLSGDSDRLTAHRGVLARLLAEADWYAQRGDAEVTSAEHVQAAIDAAEERGARIRERSQQLLEDGVLQVSTRGARVGQINGLSVLTIGRSRFGRPSRITARVRVGNGKVVDIEREVELGGPLHSKGVLILSGFLGARYARTEPLSLKASVVFEQSYGGVDGDSASLAELCALLSSVAEVPIHQHFAVTGSVNQHGDVQAIGGVNEKIEGWYDTCSKAGKLDGRQGVLVPASNVRHLMLRKDVVAACAEDRFHVWAVATVDEALELLTGVSAGLPGADGDYPEGSVNARVVEGLKTFAASARAFARSERRDG